MAAFPLGPLLLSAGVAEAVAGDSAAAAEVCRLIARHARCDWGDLCEEDKALNERALRNGGRLLSAYATRIGRVWVITEADRSATTVLLPEEY